MSNFIYVKLLYVDYECRSDTMLLNELDGLALTLESTDYYDKGRLVGAPVSAVEQILMVVSYTLKAKKGT